MNNNTINYTCLLLVFITGIYLCLIGGYGSDEDTLPMIGTFTNLMNGNFMTSRFTGYPVAEFIIGFVSYNFGSASINIIIFCSLILGVTIFFITIERNYKKQIGLFLLLILSSPILFFDNLEPVDYSLGFLFLSLGYFFLEKKKLELAIIFFGICIGTRINLAPFVIIIIFFNSGKYDKTWYRKYLIILSSLFVGSMFYFPVWINSELSFDWLRAGRPIGGFLEYSARFFYKLLVSIGIFQFILLAYLIIKKNYKKDLLKKYKFIFYLIFANLLIFFYIPAELSYLQPLLIFFYFIILKNFKEKIIYLIILINFCSWIFKFDIIKIIYKNKDICAPIVAIDVQIDPKFTQGYFKNYIDTRSKINCWIDANSDDGKKILKGQPLK